jgi:tryptophan-rich sensory protein
MKRKSAELLTLFAFLAATLAVGFLASLVTVPNIPSWYEGLHKPFFNPPNSVFAPVWTTLYVLMAVAAWRVWRKAGLRPLGLYVLQLALNFAWSSIFFGAHAIGAALVEIALLFAAVVLTLRDFWRLDRIAGWLLVPYAAWVLFAGVLNAAIWRLNG